MIKWMLRMTTKLSTKLPWHKRQRIHMLRVSGTVRKGSKTTIYRHHFLFRCSLYLLNDWRTTTYIYVFWTIITLAFFSSSRSFVRCYNAMAYLVAIKDIYPFIDSKNPEVFSCKKYFQLNNSLSVNVIIKITAWSWRAMRDTRAMWNVWVWRLVTRGTMSRWPQRRGHGGHTSGGSFLIRAVNHISGFVCY